MKTKNHFVQEIMVMVAHMGGWFCALGLFDCIVWIMKIFFERGNYY
jgi:hypothetical protein